jgi:hypothetical protein
VGSGVVWGYGKWGAGAQGKCGSKGCTCAPELHMGPE